MGSNIRIRKIGRRGDNIHRLELGRLQGNSNALKAFTRKQKIIARSSAEAELCAAALGASESKGIVSLLRDLGCEMKPLLPIDAKATEHIFHRHGIGKLKHIDVAYLWMQDEIAESRVNKTLQIWEPSHSAKH